MPPADRKTAGPVGLGARRQALQNFVAEHKATAFAEVEERETAAREERAAAEQAAKKP